MLSDFWRSVKLLFELTQHFWVNMRAPLMLFQHVSHSQMTNGIFLDIKLHFCSRSIMSFIIEKAFKWRYMFFYDASKNSIVGINNKENFVTVYENSRPEFHLNLGMIRRSAVLGRKSRLHVRWLKCSIQRRIRNIVITDH